MMSVIAGKLGKDHNLLVYNLHFLLLGSGHSCCIEDIIGRSGC